MRTTLKFFFLLLSAAHLFFSCSNNEVSCTNHEPESLTGIWEYDAGDVGVEEDLLDIRPFLSFFSEGSFSGSNSRNAIAGIYETTTPRGMNIDIQRSTYAAESAWSTAFSEVLQEADEYCVDEQTLRLINSSNNQVLTFLKKEDLSTCMPVQQDGKLFQGTEGDAFEWKAFHLNGTCLEVEINYSGGCGDSSMQLIVDEAYGESNPPVVGAQLVFTDNEPCEAWLNKTYYFDLGPIQYPGAEVLQVNFRELNEIIVVNY